MLKYNYALINCLFIYFFIKSFIYQFYPRTDEESEKIFDEKIMQLNYERKMAVLMHQSDRILALRRKVKNIDRDVEEEDDLGKEGKEKRVGNAGDNKMYTDSGTASSSSNSKVQSEVEKMILETNNEADAIFDSILGVYHTLEEEEESEKEGTGGGNGEGESSAISASSSSSKKILSVPNNVKYDVEQFLRKKKAETKRKLSEALSSDYNPIDFMDWTARSI